MSFLRGGFAAAAVVVTLTAVPAGAATVQAVFTGSVYGSADQTGLFGAPGGSLDGLGYTLTYVYDTAVGLRSTNGPGTFDDIQGGSYGIHANPTISATLQIGSVSQSLAGTYYSQYQLCNLGHCGVDQYYANAQDFSSQQDGSYTFNIFNGVVHNTADFLPDSLDTPFSVVTSALQQFGHFQFLTYDATAGVYTTYTLGSLSLDKLTVSQVGVAPVPLPASAFLLLGAVGGVGSLGLRRRNKAVATTS